MSEMKQVCAYPTYRPLSWWSRWEDVCMFEFGGYGYILQASRSRNGKLRFRSARMGGAISAIRADRIKLGGLE